MPRSLALRDIDPVSVAGVNLHLVRQTLGVTAFGINAFSADAGDELIEDHDEKGGDTGAGRHEELYVVVSGRATFTVDGEEISAPAGTLVLCQPEERRSAVAAEDGTMALVIGGLPGAGGPISPWEHYFGAAGEEDPARAYEICARGLADHPDHPSLHRSLARFAERAGYDDKAAEHRRRSEQQRPGAQRSRGRATRPRRRRPPGARAAHATSDAATGARRGGRAATGSAPTSARTSSASSSRSCDGFQNTAVVEVRADAGVALDEADRGAPARRVGDQPAPARLVDRVPDQRVRREADLDAGRDARASRGRCPRRPGTDSVSSKPPSASSTARG